MKPTWQVGDLIDLEYFLSLDDGKDDETLKKRDREIYLNSVLPVLEKERLSTELNRKMIIRLWLDKRRKMLKPLLSTDQVLPGKLFQEMFRLLKIIFLVFFMIVAIGLTSATLKYKGIEPVNVSTYLGLFVFLQMVLVIALGFFSLIRRLLPILNHTSILYSILRHLFTWVFKRLVLHGSRKLSAERRNRFRALAGTIKGKGQIYGTVFFWPIFILAQIAGIGFNLGVLSASFLKILSSDLAFGWQSTLQISADAVFMFVKALATPWSWIVSPSLAHPTYEQISASRMVLKDGIYHLTTPDLVSWWPFLLLAVVFYGLLPRITLYWAGIIARNQAIKRVRFNHAPCSSLIRRLSGPLLETDGVGVNENLNLPESARKPIRSVQANPQKQDDMGHEAVLLVPEDIFEQCLNGGWKPIMERALCLNFKKPVKIAVDFDEDKSTLAEAIHTFDFGNMTPVVLLQEAWQPPIAETLLYFRKLRTFLGKEVQILIFLIGKPTLDVFFKDVASSDLKIWSQAIQALADPFVGIYGLRKS